MRKIIFGEYDTAEDGLLTLTGWKLSAPVYKANFVAVPGRDGDLDLSTALTDGEPRYNNRELSATFESSEGTRLGRQELFEEMQNRLDGRRMNIYLPDDDEHYLVGRVSVAVDYNDLAHGAVSVTANCEPWRYAAAEMARIMTASGTEQTVALVNNGRRILVPKIVISGADASVALAYGGYSWTLSAGAYVLPDLVLRPGSNSLTYSGTGTATITYREAIL